MGCRWPDIAEVSLVESTVRSGLDAADPSEATRRFLADLDPDAFPTALFALGKAAIRMSAAVTGEHAERLRLGLVLTTPVDAADTFPPSTSVLTADHPLPTARNVAAAEHVRDFVRSLTAKDRLLVLISGGGSALLTLPAGGVSLDDIAGLSGSLMRAGCPIDGLNCVRKHCERLKGGWLGAMCPAHSTSACIISDVIGDSISTIASGPFAPDPTTYADALAILDRYACADIAPAITTHLREGRDGLHPETPKPGHPSLRHTRHTVIMGNRHAVDAACVSLRGTGFDPVTLDPHTGEARDAARRLADALLAHDAVVMGGESVVGGVPEGSVGGPMQEAVVAAALLLEADPSDWLVFGCSTDGRDGPTDAAGAAIDRRSLALARGKGLPLEAALQSHHTHPALEAMNALIRTGATGTNVNDILVALRR